MHADAVLLDFLDVRTYSLTRDVDFWILYDYLCYWLMEIDYAEMFATETIQHVLYLLILLIVNGQDGAFMGDK